MAEAPEKLSAPLLLDYLVDLGGELLAAGTSSYRLEDLLTLLGKHEGHQADIFAVPTGLFVSVRTAEGTPSAIAMIRVSEWRTDLSRLAQLDEVMNAVVSRSLTIREARVRIREIRLSAHVWPLWGQMLATMGASAGAAVSLGGTWFDFVLAACGAGVLRLVYRWLSSNPGGRFLENFIGGMVAAVFAWFAGTIFPGHSREILVLSIIVPLLPGMVLTTGLTEITYKNLVSGTARLMEAAVTLLSLVFGIALVVSLESGAGLKLELEPEGPASLLVRFLAVLLTSLCAGVIFGLSRSRLRVALIAGLVVFGANVMTRDLPSSAASFVMALLLGMSANVYARTTLQPAQTLLVPGLLLLVPGSFGFRSLDALLRGNYTAGASQFADMVIVAGALVMGLLVANVVVPSRKIL